MKTLLHKYFIIIYGLISSLLLVFGYFYETPFSTRKLMLIGLSLFYFFIIIWLSRHTTNMDNHQGNVVRQYILTLLAALTLMTIEIYSKFAINYFYHSLYIILLMFIIFNYSKRQGLILSLILMLSSIIKFIELIWIQPSQANIAISMFFLVIQLLIVLVGFFAKIYREENTMTRVLNNELIQTNKQLIRYSDEIKQLTKVEERANIARDLHDTLGHEMTGLIMQMEMASRMLQNNKVDDGLKILEDAKKSARGSLSKVRQIVNTLKNDAEIEWTKNSLYSLINDFSKKTNTLIEFNMNGEKNIKPEVGIALYRSIQESLTNAIRHGEASKIEVIINYLENKVTFNIKDNGKGCKNIIKGNGLMGMAERIDFLKGEISFNSLENGFSVKGLIPYEREEIG